MKRFVSGQIATAGLCRPPACPCEARRRFGSETCQSCIRDVELRNRKNERGEWEKEPFYTVQDLFAYGRGEKSVYLMERFMRLKTHAPIAIHWHMDGLDKAARGGSYVLSNAYNE